MKVPNVPTYEEFYGLVSNEVTDEEFDSDVSDDEIHKIVVIALSLLQEFYIKHMYDTEFFIAREEFLDEINDFNVQLKDLLLSLFDNYVSTVQHEYDLEYSIPTGHINQDFDLESVISSGVDTVTTQLYSDLKNKADFYRDVAIVTGVFSVHANFRRAIKRLTNVIDYNAQYTRNRVNRSYLEFVYGQEKLFYWRVTGVNTCAWCYELANMGAMPLSWFPVDHPNGNCWLEPVIPDDYSDDYIILMGW